jgi:hypothetical protein
VSRYDDEEQRSRLGLTYLIVNLRNLNRVTVRALPIDYCKWRGTINRMGDMVHVVRCIEVLSVPATVPPISTFRPHLSLTVIPHTNKVNHT